MLKIILSNYISFKISSLEALPKGKECLTVIEKHFQYKNPKFIEAVKWGRMTYGIEKYLYSYLILGDDFKLYRGCYTRLTKILKQFNIDYTIQDFTLTSDAVKIFHDKKFEPRKDQAEFISKFIEYTDSVPVKQGILLAHTSYGKTNAAIYTAQELQQTVTVLVHTTFAQKQWISTLKDDFYFSEKDIGGAGGVFRGKPKVTNKVNVALYHSMSKKEINIHFKDKTGFLVVDECQLASIDQFRKSILAFKPRYQIFMTAGSKDITGTPQVFRNDGLEFVIKDLGGEVIYRSDDSNTDSKTMAEIFSTPTNFRPQEEHPSAIKTEMSQIRERNILIAKRAVTAVKNNKQVMIFVERKEQAAVLGKFLSKFRVGFLMGNLTKKEIAELDVSDKAKEILLNNDPETAFDDVKEKCLKKELDIVICTQKGEVGLSIETLGHGIVTFPVGNIERFNQIKGRFERKHKEERLEKYGEKPTPYIEMIVDNYASSINSWSSVKEHYKEYIIKNPYKIGEG